MKPTRLTGRRSRWVVACALLLIPAGLARCAEDEAQLRSLIEQQRRQVEHQHQRLEQLKQQLNELEARSQNKPKPPGGPARGADEPDPAAARKDDQPDPDAVKNLVSDYLKGNPVAGMPPGVQTGFFSGQGFVIRSALDPSYVKWPDESRIPFELRIHGRIQADYYGYKVPDDQNHETEQHQVAQNANARRFADFSQLEVKRMRLIFEGNVFDPGLRYYIQLDGSTRGIAGSQTNKVLQTAGAFDPNTAAASPLGGGVTVDHAVRLFSAYVAYDFHPCGCWKGCGPDCPDGSPRHAPTLTLIAGKDKVLFGLENALGTANEQFVEWSMAEWMFDADEGNQLTQVAAHYKGFDDRLFVDVNVNNGPESGNVPNTLMDELPGLNAGFWWDFGGNWNAQRQRWDLFGDCLSDIDYSCKPAVRVGGAVELAPTDRRSLYGDGEEARAFVMPGAPGGTRLINLLNGDGSTAATTPRGAHAVDKFDYYTYNAFLAGKYRGFSLYNEWWFRDLTGFKAAPNGNDLIFYTYTDPRTKSTVTALFPDKALFDYGMTLQAGYFLIPKKLEVAARWSWISGDSGDVLGDTHLPPTVIAVPNGVPGRAAGGLTRVQVNPGAFSHFHEADEYAVGVNHYFRRQLVKWQTDLSYYRGGNPAGSGASLAGFIPGEDGWLVRTQFQLAF